MEKKKSVSMRTVLLVLLASAWTIPILFFSWFIFHDYRNAYMEKTDSLVSNAMGVSGALVYTDVDEAIQKIQKPTYEGEWEKEYNRYKKNLATRNEYMTLIKASLMSKYYMDNQVARYAFYLEEEEIPSAYSGKNGYGYADYMDGVNDLVQEFMAEGSNYVKVMVIDGDLYLLRNLYTVNDYKKYGTLVLGLNVTDIIDGLPLENKDLVRIYFDDSDEFICEGHPEEEESEKTGRVHSVLADKARESAGGSQIIRYSLSNYMGYAYTYNCDNYKMVLQYIAYENVLNAGVNKLNIMLAVSFIFLLPFILLTYYFMTYHINKPMDKLIDAADKIAGEEFGVTVEGDEIIVEEFGSLVDTFNTMSLNVKHLFDTVYIEQMAKKDAQIEALQAQINPHFLYNTLEMMNWQSRMNGDIETSKMIEALGTVLDSSMNRSNDRTVRMADEFRCADAFLYIMSMRFGQRLKVEKNVEPQVNQARVPQLVLQPLLENAIKHGIEKVGNGTVWIDAYEMDENIIIDVSNSSEELSAEEMTRIEDIISGKTRLNKSQPGVHNSIGIYNVNKRIKLIFGDDFGLKILQENGKFISRIVIPMQQEEA